MKTQTISTKSALGGGGPSFSVWKLVINWKLIGKTFWVPLRMFSEFCWVNSSPLISPYIGLSCTVNHLLCSASMLRNKTALEGLKSLEN